MSKCASLGALSAAGVLWAFAPATETTEQTTTVMTDLIICMGESPGSERNGVVSRTNGESTWLDTLDKELNVCGKKFIAVWKGVLEKHLLESLMR